MATSFGEQVQARDVLPDDLIRFADYADTLQSEDPDIGGALINMPEMYREFENYDNSTYKTIKVERRICQVFRETSTGPNAYIVDDWKKPTVKFVKGSTIEDARLSGIVNKDQLTGLTTAPSPPSEQEVGQLLGTFFANILTIVAIYFKEFVGGEMFDKALPFVNPDYPRTPLDYFRSISGHIATGISKKYLYYGTLWSCSALHPEDCNLHSAAYLHVGAAKIWRIVRPSDTKRFIEKLKSLYDDSMGCITMGSNEQTIHSRSWDQVLFTRAQVTAPTTPTNATTRQQELEKLDDEIQRRQQGIEELKRKIAASTTSRKQTRQHIGPHTPNTKSTLSHSGEPQPSTSKNVFLDSHVSTSGGLTSSSDDDHEPEGPSVPRTKKPRLSLDQRIREATAEIDIILHPSYRKEATETIEALPAPWNSAPDDN